MENDEFLIDIFAVRHDEYTIQRTGERRYVRRGAPSVETIFQPLPLKVTPKLISLHLEGHITIGVYSQSGDKAKWLCLDDDQGLDRLHQIQRFFKEQFILLPYLEKSRRGAHLWLFCQEAVEAFRLRLLANYSMEELKLDKEALDIFPSRDDVGDGFGRAVRLPWGVHQASDEVYLFQDIPGETPALQIAWLKENVHRLPTQRLDQIITTIQPEEEPLPGGEKPRELRPVTGSYIDEVKARLPILEFAEKITNLTPSDGSRGRYYLGKCPFHPDEHPSFWVDVQLGLANCFRAHCGGEKPMDVVNLYARHNEITNTEAIYDLCDQLGITPLAPGILAKVPGLEMEESDGGEAGEELEAVRQAYDEWLSKLYGDPSGRGGE